MIPATFEVKAEPIGTFTFRKRTMRDQMWIVGEGARIEGGGHGFAGLTVRAERLAAIRRLVVASPPGWTTHLPAAEHKVSLDGVGEFVFRARQPDDDLWIEGEAVRIAGGPHSSLGLDWYCLSFAAVDRLTVKAPPGFKVDDLDPLSNEDVELVGRIHEALRGVDGGDSRRLLHDIEVVGGALDEAEARFRGRAGTHGAAPGGGHQRHGRVSVPPQIQPAAD